MDDVETYAWERSIGEDGWQARDFETAPYERQERRVAEFLWSLTGIGGGDDPIGFMMTQHDMSRLEIRGLERLLRDAGVQLELDDQEFAQVQGELQEWKFKADLANSALENLVSLGNDLVKERARLRQEVTKLEKELLEAQREKTRMKEWLLAAEKEWLRVRKGEPIARDALFVGGCFTAHSGATLSYKVECDALTEIDVWTAAAEIARHETFSEVVGVPRGGLRLADALRPYCGKEGGLLLVDDVLTTGASMEEERARRGGDCRGVVLFSRGPCPEWITPWWRSGYPRRTYHDWLLTMRQGLGCRMDVATESCTTLFECYCVRAAKAAVRFDGGLTRPPAEIEVAEVVEELRDEDAALLDKVKAIAEPHSVTVIGLGPEAVNVMGDARAYLPSVIVRFPLGMSWEDIDEISRSITNNVRVSRVLMEAAPVTITEGE